MDMLHRLVMMLRLAAAASVCLLLLLSPVAAQDPAVIPTVPAGGDNAPIIPTIDPQATSAANPTCPALVDEALLRVSALCDGTGRNEACYGNTAISMTQRPNTQPISFFQPGDLASVSVIESLRTSPLDLQTGEWGVSLLRIQANLPDTLPGQNVTMLVFGDVQIQNPGRSATMQSFFVQTSFQGVVCEDAPRDGIMLQTPGDAGPVQLRINDVDIELGSTVFIGFHQQSAMRIFTLEGEANVTALGTEVQVLPGQRTGVGLQNLRASAAPSNPSPFTLETELGGLVEVIDLLPEPIELPETTPPPDATPSGAVVLPTLPTTGECVIATGDTVPVNIRQRPTIDAPIVGALDPTQTYPVIGRDNTGQWYQTLRGWSSAGVTRLGGICTNVPVNFIQVTPTPTIAPSITPSGRIAGNNEYPNVQVPFVDGQPVAVFGAVSYPEGDRQDTVSWQWVGWDSQQYDYSGFFYVSVRCSGTGVENAVIVFGNGSSAFCSSMGQRFTYDIFEQPVPNGSVTVSLIGGSNAYIDWEVSMGFSLTPNSSF
jgi:hypothetical protein